MFVRAELNQETFHSCDLRRSDWLGAIVYDCVFTKCDLTTALITGARFEKCLFTECDFTEAYIFRSQFKESVFHECDMVDTMLSTVDFPGTDFFDVRWNGTFINKPPLIVDGIEYPIVALDNGYMQVGCEFNTMDWFWKTDEKHSASMEGLRARRFWKKNKGWIFDMLKARGLYDK